MEGIQLTELCFSGVWSDHFLRAELLTRCANFAGSEAADRERLVTLWLEKEGVISATA